MSHIEVNLDENIVIQVARDKKIELLETVAEFEGYQENIIDNQEQYFSGTIEEVDRFIGESEGKIKVLSIHEDTDTLNFKTVRYLKIIPNSETKYHYGIRHIQKSIFKYIINCIENTRIGNIKEQSAIYIDVEKEAIKDYVTNNFTGLIIQ